MTLREYAKLMNDTALQGSLSIEEYNRLYNPLLGRHSIDDSANAYFAIVPVMNFLFKPFGMIKSGFPREMS